MSDSISGFTVIFEESVTEEYMSKVKETLKLIKHVGTVEPIVEDVNTFIGQSKESTRIKRVLIDLIKSDFK